MGVTLVGKSGGGARRAVLTHEVSRSLSCHMTSGSAGLPQLRPVWLTHRAKNDATVLIWQPPRHIPIRGMPVCFFLVVKSKGALTYSTSPSHHMLSWSELENARWQPLHGLQEELYHTPDLVCKLCALNQRSRTPRPWISQYLVGQRVSPATCLEGMSTSSAPPTM